MLQRFLQNTAISAVAYGFAGVLGLLAVGLIARSYSLSVLGLIVLARAFLPGGFLSLLDFGFSETATQAIARGRVGDWRAASEKVSLLTVIAAVTGTISGIALWISSESLAAIFKVVPNEVEAFNSILEVTALVLPIAFLGLVTEGALKGFEEYGWLRLTEVATNVLYVASIYLAIWRGAPFELIAYSYLATTIIAKYLVLAVVVCRLALPTPLRFVAWGGASRRDILYRSWLMFNGRIVGVLQHTAAPLAIGILFSPAEVGTFDLITRLPRFLKAIMAPLYSAILPISARIEEASDSRRLQILGRNSLVFPGAIALPVLIVMALLSKQILYLWVGPQNAERWQWLALSLCVPATTILLGGGQAALMVRSDFLRYNTRLLYLQVLTQYLLIGMTLLWFQERAFIFGWAVSHILFVPVFAHYMLSEMDLRGSLFWRQLVRHAAVAAILAALVVACKYIHYPGNLAELVIFGALGCLAAWSLSFMIILTRDERLMLGRFVRIMTNR
ncbi:teichoic acid transporter [Bradyrhizobium sp. CNPSo 4010]|uniref:Teichoic acid transporter n=1 Tax=Bradyrhizobium agreste TaxID=2751811 RepID=A0ABS0PVH8_9BRAD|nr:teichoic acid transporter [Bradyrhizobium agreste]MBH5401206.1 teichoic acid transporter [Bradyrhizobium agreste]